MEFTEAKWDLSSDLDINIFWEKVFSIKNGMNENCFSDLANFAFNLISLPHSSAFSVIKNKVKI